VDGSLDLTADLIADTARLAAELGHRHFYGISMLNSDGLTAIEVSRRRWPNMPAPLNAL